MVEHPAANSVSRELREPFKDSSQGRGRKYFSRDGLEFGGVSPKRSREQARCVPSTRIWAWGILVKELDKVSGGCNNMTLYDTIRYDTT